MNEPNNQPVDQWAAVLNDTIAGLRDAGSKHWFLAPGADWTKARTWQESGNAQYMAGVADPAEQMLIDIHLYFDK